MLYFCQNQGGGSLNIHDRIKHLRKGVLKLTQQEFSDALNISRSNMGNIEIGRIAVTDRVISDICLKYNVNEKWLRFGTGEVFVELSREEYIAEFIGRTLKNQETSFKKRYIEMLSKLDDEGWEALEKVAISMGQIKVS